MSGLIPYIQYKTQQIAVRVNAENKFHIFSAIIPVYMNSKGEFVVIDSTVDHIISSVRPKEDVRVLDVKCDQFEVDTFLEIFEMMHMSAEVESIVLDLVNERLSDITSI